MRYHEIKKIKEMLKLSDFYAERFIPKEISSVPCDMGYFNFKNDVESNTFCYLKLVENK